MSSYPNSTNLVQDPNNPRIWFHSIITYNEHQQPKVIENQQPKVIENQQPKVIENKQTKVIENKQTKE